MTFRKLQKLLAAGMVTTMAATTVLGNAPINISKAASKVAVAKAQTEANTINGVNADDEGVYKVTMDDTGYLTADADAAANVNTPFSWDNANVYFVITDRFENGNTENDHSYGRGLDKAGNAVANYQNKEGYFHGGDLAGMTKKIEEGYFDKLGTNAIWITAPYEQIHGALAAGGFKHYAYHGYYVLDYTEVDANMGTAEDLEKFIDTAHEHGIRVVFDIVMNHAGYANPKDAAEFGYGKLAANWEEIYYWDDTKYKWFNDYVAEASQNGSQGMMDAQNGDWETNWWGSKWVRMTKGRFANYANQAEEASGVETCLDGLPDFVTEGTSDPGMPGILKKKWGAEKLAQEEKELDEFCKNYGMSKCVTTYITKWLTDWVREYGVDGFRCDTAKHVNQSEWGKLKKAGVQALKEWRKNNPDKPGAQWTDDFWMTGEAWDHGVNKDGYYTTGGFDSMINFSYQGTENKSGAALEGTYSDYAQKLNSDPSFNVLSYISSHDTALGARSANAGTALLLTPGGVQTYYGDESGRPGDGTSDKQPTRSNMNWDSIKNDANTQKILANWQKVGQFRRNHIAVGAGQHKQLDGTNYTFSRTYTGKANVGAEQKTDYSDAVVVCLPGKATTTDVTVGTTFGDATTVRDFYSGEVYEISGGVVKDVKCDENGVILLEVPTESVATSSVSASPAGGTYKTDTVEVTLKAKDATETYYQIGDGAKTAYKDGDKITIGADTAYEEETVIKLTGKGTDKDGNPTDLSKELKFARDKEPVFQGVASDHFYIRVKKSDFKEAPKIWAYSGKTSYTGTAWASRPSLKEEGDYYVFEAEEAKGEVEFILTTEDGWRSTEDQKPGLKATGAVEYSKADNATTVIPGEAVETGKVTINYMDKATEKPIKTIYRVGKIGDAYTAYEGSFAGYKLEGIPENSKGTFTKEEITVNYYYVAGDAPVTAPPATVEPTPASPTPTAADPTPTALVSIAPATTAPAAPTATAPVATDPAPTAPAPVVTEPVQTAAPTAPAPVVTEPVPTAPAPVITEAPTQAPATSTAPTTVPTNVPTTVPTNVPTTVPTNVPTQVPTAVPTAPVTQAALSVKSLTSNVASPQTLGTSVKFTAQGQGGSGSYEYRFDVARIVNAVAVPTVFDQKYTNSNEYLWTPTITGDYQVTVRVKDTKTGNVKTATVAYVIRPKSTGTGVKRLSVTKFAAAKGSAKYSVKLSAAATGGTGTKQFKFVRAYTSKGKLKYKTLKNYSTSATTTWKAPKSGTYTFKLYVKDKKGLKIQLTRKVKITSKTAQIVK